MNNKMIRRSVFLLLVLAYIFLPGDGSFSPVEAEAAGGSGELTLLTVYDALPSGYTVISGATLYDTKTLDMWHYSGGYWKVGNVGSEKIQISDSAFNTTSLGRITADSTASFIFSLPEGVSNALSQGKKVAARVGAFGEAELNELFDLSGMKFVSDGSSLHFSATPKFNVMPRSTLSYIDHYCLAIKYHIPFIEEMYGCNIYSMFGSGFSGKQANGWVDPSRPSDTATPDQQVHPAMVKDTSGKLKSGYTVRVGSTAAGSGNLSIGQGTFINGGACGLHFEYPVSVAFYLMPETPTATETPETPEEPTPPVEEPEVPEPAELPDISARACLDLPSKTYEGHQEIARDRSIYTVNGTEWSAAAAYGAKYGVGKISLEQDKTGTIEKLTSVRSRVSFPRPGTYMVGLRTTPAGGTAVTDVKAITVLSTPTVLASLGGAQKENRKQILTVNVATNPEYPLTKLAVVIRDRVTGQEICLNHALAGGTNTAECEGTMYSRPIQALTSDAFFTRCKLEFLTKNPESRQYTYTVTAEDSRGHKDTATATFTVEPDLPPQAVIELDKLWLREDSSNIARITAKDATVSTDGDQSSRTWLVAMSDKKSAEFTDSDFRPLSYEDLSFGTGGEIAFNKEGVGSFALRLNVTETWPEETLEEFVTAEDRRKGSAQATAEVENTAPVVSLEPKMTKPANVLILSGENSGSRGNQLSAELKALLTAEGMDPQIRVSSSVPENAWTRETAGWNVYRQYTIQEPYGAEGSTIAAGNSYLTDNSTLYTVQAYWASAAKGSPPSYPYRITAYQAVRTEDGSEGRAKWSYTISSAADFSMSTDSTTWQMAQDENGKYLFLRNGEGKTLVLDKAGGARQTVLNFSVGDLNCTGENCFYSFKPDGIWKVAANGSVSRIYSGALQTTGGRMVGGKIHCLLTEGQSLYRLIFDPSSQTTAKKFLIKMQAVSMDQGAILSATLKGVDTNGSMAVTVSDVAGSEKSLHFYIFDSEGAMEAQAQNADAPAGLTYTPVSDGFGVYNYYLTTSRNKTSSYYRTHLTCTGVRDGTLATQSIKNSADYPTETDVLFAREINGKVYAVTGGIWAAIMNYNGYESRAFLWTCDPAKGTLTGETGTSLAVPQTEYGMSRDIQGALRYDDDAAEQINGSVTSAVRWKLTADQLLYPFAAANCGGADSVGSIGSGSGAGGRQVMILLTDGEGIPDETCDLTETKALLQNKGIELTFADASTTPEELAQRISGAETADWLKVTPGSSTAPATLTKSFDLEQGAEYYFRYEIAARNSSGGQVDIQKKEPNTKAVFEQQSVPGAVVDPGSAGQTYYIKEHIAENFDGTGLNSFFGLNQSLCDHGVYKAATLTVKSGNSNGYRSASSSFTFTVPDGEKGVLSFDYILSSYSGAKENTCYFLIDGERWYVTQTLLPLNQQELRGTYHHPRLLGAGAHTVQAVASMYSGGKSTSYTYLDNLSFDMLAPGNTGTVGGGQQALGRTTQGWTVSGTLSVPSRVVSYGEQAEAEYTNMPVAQAPCLAIVAQDSLSKTYTLSVPAGKTAVLLRLGTESVVSSKTDALFQGVGLTWENYGRASGSQYLSDINSPYTLHLPQVAGNQTLVASWEKTSGNSATFTNLEMMAAAPNASTEAGDFFIERGKLFAVEKETTGGETKITLNLPSGVSAFYIRNFVLYKKQAEAVSATSEDPLLTGWTVTGAVTEVSALPELPEGESTPLVYKKGQLVSYGIQYSDRESDPSGAQFWEYIHTPDHDGAHPQAAVVLDKTGGVVSQQNKVLSAPILRFYIDGKYTARHWQRDDTSRGKGGNADYDKVSDAAEVTFFIQGEEGADPKLVTEEKIIGWVNHTDEWDQNRKKYNLRYFGQEYNQAVNFESYCKERRPRKRATNVFWSGEAFELMATPTGTPGSVTCKITGTGYQTALTNSGRTNAEGQTIYTGTLWSKEMINKWGRDGSEQLEFCFTAVYADGTRKEHKVNVILDTPDSYWLLHRLW